MSHLKRPSLRSGSEDLLDLFHFLESFIFPSPLQSDPVGSEEVSVDENLETRQDQV